MGIDMCRLILIRDAIEDRANEKLDNKLRAVSPCDVKPIEKEDFFLICFFFSNFADFFKLLLTFFKILLIFC